MLEFVDTHCHIQDALALAEDDLVAGKWAKAGVENPQELIGAAVEAGVKQMLCVGTTLDDSKRAVELAQTDPYCYASIGIHPHEAKDYVNNADKWQQFCNFIVEDRVVAVGECGLDYYYNHSPKQDQKALLKMQIELALKHDKPLIFHVRNAFEDFWSIFDQYTGIRGVIHSFSATELELDQTLSRGLYVGLNGIVTFSRNQKQLDAAKATPLERMLLETDAPFLTPVPFRGKICQPKHVVQVAEFLAELRGESLEQIAQNTTKNAKRLFGI